MEFVIISGLSGAGKSKAASFMEDMDFFCVDNLPAPLIPKFAELGMAGSGEYDRVVLVTDIRSGTKFDSLFQALDDLKAMKCSYRILFMEASDEVIIKRYKETRRRHPLQGQTASLEEAVERERMVMAPIRDRADFVIDTSRTSTAQLRRELMRLFGKAGETGGGMSVSVTSFGFKYGLPMEADLVFDVRFMPNPFYIDELRHQTGLDAPVRDYVFRFQQTQEYLKRLKDLLAFSLPLYAEEGKTMLVIAVGCTGGHHRSVAVTHALAEYIRELGYSTSEHHRDLERGV